jgi:hypothetical protein
LSQAADLPDLDGVDGQRAAVDAPSGLRPEILVVVSQVPDDVLRAAALAACPVMRDAGDASECIPGLGTRRVDLADDSVFGALDTCQRRHGTADGRSATVGVHGLQ